MLHHEFEQRLHALIARAFGLLGHPAILAGAVEDWKIELIVIGVERREEVEHLVDDLGRARIVLVDLVDRDDGLEAELQRLADNELGLRHRAFGGIHQHDHAIDHREDALDLAAEIGVAGRVDDVDLRIFEQHRGAFREDGDAALFFELVAIHRPLRDALIVAEGA